MAVAAIGLTPISPTIEVVPVVEIPDFARITKLPAVPRSTGCGPAATVVTVVKAPHFITCQRIACEVLATVVTWQYMCCSL